MKQNEQWILIAGVVLVAFFLMKDKDDKKGAEG